MDEVNPKDASRVLDIVYKKALDGIPKVSPSVDELVDDYVRKNPTPRKAAWGSPIFTTICISAGSRRRDSTPATIFRATTGKEEMCTT